MFPTACKGWLRFLSHYGFPIRASKINNSKNCFEHSKINLKHSKKEIDDRFLKQKKLYICQQCNFKSIHRGSFWRHTKVHRSQAAGQRRRRRRRQRSSGQANAFTPTSNTHESTKPATMGSMGGPRYSGVRRTRSSPSGTHCSCCASATRTRLFGDTA